MNKVRVYNDNEIKILLSNPNVERIKNKSQITNIFKLYRTYIYNNNYLMFG